MNNIIIEFLTKMAGLQEGENKRGNKRKILKFSLPGNLDHSDKVLIIAIYVTIKRMKLILCL